MERSRGESGIRAAMVAAILGLGSGFVPMMSPAAPAIVADDVAKDDLPGSPNGPSRAEVEGLIRRIGRDAPTPERVDEVLSYFVPRGKLLGRTVERTERFATDAGFVARMDRLCRELTGKPADTRTLVSRAAQHVRGHLDDQHREELIDEFQRLAEPKKALRGRVVDEADRPIPGAMASIPGALTTTDERGDFVLNFTRRDTPYARISFEARGYGLGDISFLVESIADADGLSHRLLKQAACDGRVVDEDGGGIAGAEIQLWISNVALSRELGDEHRTGPGSQVIFRARTDADGRYAFRSLPPKGELADYALKMGASHPDYLSNEDDFGDDQDPRPGITIPLRRGCVVEGVVTDPAGKPVPLAWVRVLIGESDPGWWQDGSIAYTDAAGKFRFGNLAPGDHAIVVEPEGFAMAVAKVAARPDAATEVQVVVPAGGFLTGRVLDPDGKPAAAVAVGQVAPLRMEGNALRNVPAPVRSARTGADGSFRIGPVPEGWYRLAASPGAPRADVSAEVRTGESRVEIRLGPPPEAREGGGPIPEIRPRPRPD